MRTGCYLVAAIIAAHAGAAFAGGYLRVTGPPPLRFQSPPVLTESVSANTKPAAPTSNDSAPPCPPDTRNDISTAVTTTVVTANSSDPQTNSPPAIVFESTSSAASPPADQSTEQPTERPPLTSQVLAEIFRHTAGNSTNQSATVVLTGGFMPPQPGQSAGSRSSSATYTDH